MLSFVWELVASAMGGEAGWFSPLKRLLQGAGSG